jgi:hypothetical protein
MSIREGAMAASNMPKNILAANKEWKLWAAAVQAVAIPQQKMFAPSHFATGTFCKTMAGIGNES